MNLIELQVQEAIQRRNLYQNHVEAQIQIVREIVRTFLSVETWVEQEKFVKYLTKKFSFDERSIRDELRKARFNEEQTSPVKVEIRLLIKYIGYAVKKCLVDAELITMNLIEFQIQEATQRSGFGQSNVKAQQIVREVVRTFLSVETWVEQEKFVKHATEKLDVDMRVIRSELQKARSKETSTTSQTQQAKDASEKLTPRAQIERQLIEALIHSPALISNVKPQFHYQDFTEPNFIRVAQLLWKACSDDENVDIQTLINECPDEKLSAFLSSAILQRMPPNLQARVDGCLKKLQHFLLQDLERRVRSHALAEGADEMETLEESWKLSDQRRALHNRDKVDTRGENPNEGGS